MTAGARATVLVVDDEADVADAYAAQLTDRYAVRTAYSGEAALSALAPDVDVVLLDRRMPELSGDDVLAAIRDRDLDARVAMITAVDPDFDIIDMPFDDYVVKPADGETLRGTVEGLLERAEYERHLREYCALTSKHAALSASKPRGELTDSAEFERLEAEIERHRVALDDILDGFDDEDYVAVLDDPVDP